MKPGEYIPLCTEGDVEYVSGHVSDEDAMLVVHEETGMDLDAPVTIRHDYARWIPVPPDSDYDMELRLSKPGRGAFKVTTVEYMG